MQSRQILLTCMIALGLMRTSPIRCQETPLLAGSARALLIGINDYENVTDLGGCVNDVRAMEHMLRSRFGFEHVTRLEDREATRAAILASLRREIAATGPDDIFFLHFSGHGSQVADLDGDEVEDLTDETIVPADGRGEDGPADIVDDEIDAVLSTLRCRAAVVYFDSCHSGTGTRAESAPLQHREIPEDTRRHLYANRIRTRHIDQDSGQYVLITSAAAREKALDGPVDGTKHGLFTAALLRALARSSPDWSARKLFDAAEMEYSRIVEQLGVVHRASTPQLEIPASRLDEPLFPLLAREVKVARRPWLPLALVDGALSIRDGARAAPIGSSWGIHAQGDRQFLPGTALAVGQVLEHRGDSALLRLSRHGASIETLAGCRAVLIAPAAPGLSIRVLPNFTGEKRVLLAEALREAIPSCKVVNPEHPDGGDYYIEYDKGTYLVKGADAETPIATSRDPAGVGHILRRSIMVNRLLALDNPTSGLGIVVSVEGGDSPEPAKSNADPGRRIKMHGRSNRGAAFVTHRDGDRVTPRNSPTLVIETDQPCYVTVVAIDEVGRVQLVFPNPMTESSEYFPRGWVDAATVVRIPDSLEEPNLAGFVMTLETGGLQSFRVFATDLLSTASRFRDTISRIDDLQADNPDFDTEPMIASLRDDLLSLATREIAMKGVETKKRRERPEGSAPLPVGSNEVGEPDDESHASGGGDWCATGVSIRVAARGDRR